MKKAMTIAGIMAGVGAMGYGAYMIYGNKNKKVKMPKVANVTGKNN